MHFSAFHCRQVNSSTTVDTSPTSEHVGVSSACNSSVPLRSENVLASSLGAPSCNPQFLTNPLLSFIKAFRLKGDRDSLMRVVSERYSPNTVEVSKRVLWRQELNC